MATIKLFESWLKTQAINEFGPHGGIDLGPIDRWSEKEILPKIESNPTYNMFYEKLKVMFKKNGIVFFMYSRKSCSNNDRLDDDVYIVMEQNIPSRSK